MSCIIIVRNPQNQKLIAIENGETAGAGDVLAEWDTEDEAHEAAKTIPVCRAWGYDVLELNI